MEFESNSFVVGMRVEDGDGFKGTVRYIGPVATAKSAGDWLGIEWDVSSRGKHDGSCTDSNNVVHQYFTCAQGAGSFVKPSKVHRGKTFVEALHEKYVSMDAPQVAPDDILPDAYVVTAKGALKSIEFVGEKKIRKRQQLDEVTKVALRNCGVSTCGDGVAEVAGHFIEVDLQDNLLSNWDEVATLCSHIPGLKSLQLHGNKIKNVPPDWPDSPNFPRSCFDRLTTLALNFCGITSFATVACLERVLPSIEELYVAANDLSDLTPLSPTQFPRLRVFDLSSCGLTSWSSVCECLGKLASLQELILDSNPITELLPRQEGQFDSLTRLSLTATRLTSWVDVDALETYPNLSALRLTHVPLFSGRGASEVRPEVIARLSRLHIFNASLISHRERTDAEKTYLRKALRHESALAAGETVEIDPVRLRVELRAAGPLMQHIHPRFAALNDKYGAELLPLGVGGESGIQSMAADMISLTLQNMAFTSGGSLEPLQKKLPATLTIGKLRLIVKQLFGVEPHLQSLAIRQYKDSVPTLMDEDEATIRYYGAIDGSYIYVNECDEV
mmetsp:Transcript_3249/g.5056  ORF Transcript_3249/g.5056 Transcript_3249/m.5056 type:complete len:558 (-) Transcript_3249:81-1754(-)